MTSARAWWCIIILGAALGGSWASGAELEKLLDQAWYAKAPPLPKPAGEVVRASTVAELYSAVDDVKPGGTVLVADGTYMMTRTLQVQKDNVTVRSESGDRRKVVLDFARSQHGEGVAFSRCTGATLADLTVQNVKWNGIKVNSDLGASRVSIYNVVGHNVWQRQVKGPRVPDKDGQPAFVEGCRVQYCLFYNDRAKQKGDDPYEDGEPERFGFNYVGGIDAMAARGWVISDNVFVGIRGKTGEARGAVFLWQNATDCVVERNVIIDCDTGIALGNSSARGERRHCNGVIVRNNFVTRCPETGILADHTRDCRIVHNTVFDPGSRLGRLVRVLHASDGLVVANNLFCGPRISIEQHEGKIDVRDNLVRAVTGYFVDAGHGNLRLTEKAAEAIDHAAPMKEVAEDIDRQSRGEKPDLGAHEFQPAATR